MTKSRISSLSEYFEVIESISQTNYDIVLYRGQSSDNPLLPSIARANQGQNTIEIEKEMLNELRRRTQLSVKTPMTSDWEWLIYAQHHGMKTRLLDWSSNPLAALWFACSLEYKMEQDSFVYILTANNDLLINTQQKIDPFTIVKTRILRPALNNERIIAQSGWFTAHPFSLKHNKFIKLETNRDWKQNIIKIRIPSEIKKEILKTLSIFGINSQSLYPDLVGLCSHLNWMYIWK